VVVEDAENLTMSHLSTYFNYLSHFSDTLA